jgi:hypothetical protein
MLYQVHLSWGGFKLTTLVVIGTDCIWSYQIIIAWVRFELKLFNNKLFYNKHITQLYYLKNDNCVMCVDYWKAWVRISLRRYTTLCESNYHIIMPTMTPCNILDGWNQIYIFLSFYIHLPLNFK